MKPTRQQIEDIKTRMRDQRVLGFDSWRRYQRTWEVLADALVLVDALDELQARLDTSANMIT